MFNESFSLKQDDYSYKEFLFRVERIEKYFTEEICRQISCKTIWVTDGIFDIDSFVNTTVSDYHEVYGDINIAVLTTLESFANPIVIKVCEPRKGEFRSKIKFTPKGALSLSTFMVAVEDNGEKKLCRNQGHPVLQKERYLAESCRKAFDGNAGGDVYKEIAENAWEYLEYNRLFACCPTEQLAPFYGRKDISRAVQKALSANMDYKELYGVTYLWNNILFVFPIERERMKEVFKDRGKINGRRRVMPTIVKEHKRKGVDVVAHIRAGTYPIIIDGRTFGIYMGAGDFDTTLVNMKQAKNMRKKLKDAVIDDGMYAL